MKKIVLATALLFGFSASALTAQPCGTRANGSLTSSKSYDNLLLDAGKNAAAGATTVRTQTKIKGAR